MATENYSWEVNEDGEDSKESLNKKDFDNAGDVDRKQAQKYIKMRSYYDSVFHRVGIPGRHGAIRRATTDNYMLGGGKGDLFDGSNEEVEESGNKLSNVKLHWMPLFRGKLERVYHLRQSVKNCEKMKGQVEKDIKIAESKRDMYLANANTRAWYNPFRIPSKLQSMWENHELRQLKHFEHGINRTQDIYQGKIDKYDDKVAIKKEKHQEVLNQVDNIYRTHTDILANTLKVHFNKKLEPQDKKNIKELYGRANTENNKKIQIMGVYFQDIKEFEEYIKSLPATDRNSKNLLLDQLKQLSKDANKTRKMHNKHAGRVAELNEYSKESMEKRLQNKRAGKLFYEKFQERLKEDNQVSFETENEMLKDKVFKIVRFDNKIQFKAEVSDDSFALHQNGEVLMGDDDKLLSHSETAALLKSISKIKISDPAKPEATEEVAQPEEATTESAQVQENPENNTAILESKKPAENLSKSQENKPAENSQGVLNFEETVKANITAAESPEDKKSPEPKVEKKKNLKNKKINIPGKKLTDIMTDLGNGTVELKFNSEFYNKVFGENVGNEGWKVGKIENGSSVRFSKGQRVLILYTLPNGDLDIKDNKIPVQFRNNESDKLKQEWIEVNVSKSPDMDENFSNQPVQEKKQDEVEKVEKTEKESTDRNEDIVLGSENKDVVQNQDVISSTQLGSAENNGRENNYDYNEMLDVLDTSTFDFDGKNIETDKKYGIENVINFSEDGKANLQFSLDFLHDESLNDKGWKLGEINDKMILSKNDDMIEIPLDSDGKSVKSNTKNIVNIYLYGRDNPNKKTKINYNLETKAISF